MEALALTLTLTLTLTAGAIQMEALALETATESGAKQETNKDAAKSSRPIDWTVGCMHVGYTCI